MTQNRTDEPPITNFNGVKVFSATMAQDREALGSRLTAWIQSNPLKQIVHTIITQSSDAAFHCLAITVFFLESSAAPTPGK